MNTINCGYDTMGKCEHKAVFLGGFVWGFAAHKFFLVLGAAWLNGN